MRTAPSISLKRIVGHPAGDTKPKGGSGAGGFPLHFDIPMVEVGNVGEVGAISAMDYDSPASADITDNIVAAIGLTASRQVYHHILFFVDLEDDPFFVQNLLDDLLALLLSSRFGWRRRCCRGGVPFFGDDALIDKKIVIVFVQPLPNAAPGLAGADELQPA